MGIICPLSPEMRVLNRKNHQLEQTIRQQIALLQHYQFTSTLAEAVSSMPVRYLYTQAILEDIDRLHATSRTTYAPRTEWSGDWGQDDLRNSCLILQNEAKDSEDKEDNPDSFLSNLKKNQSLVVQINILYRQDVNYSEYSSSLDLFLRWANMFQEHTFGGFLKPLYRHFYLYLQRLDVSELATLIDEVCVFVQLLVAVVTEAYGLKSLAACERGRLVKNENVYNLIMSIFFKRTKIKELLLRAIREKEADRIASLQRNIKRLSKKPISYFGVSPKFTLGDDTLEQSNLSSGQSLAVREPYEQSLKLVRQLGENGSPVTKLKTIIAISKQIVRDLDRHHQARGREAPEMDPDNLAAIVMYLLARTASPNLLEELRIVENFTTTNCLNCISGYYLQLFMAAQESILSWKFEQH